MKSIKLITLIVFLIALISCDNTAKKDDKSYAHVIDLPVSYAYPADSITINKWIAANDFNAMYKHSWEVWKHLTTPVDGKVLRYQTWLSPAQILDKMNNPSKNSVSEIEFNKPKQFGHAKLRQADFDDTNIVEVVAYNKAAENFAIDNKIFYLSTLQSMQKGEYSQIPDFPNDAITIKPVYKIITANNTNENGIFTMSAWHGPEYKNSGYPEKEWKSCIHIDTKKSGNNVNGRIDYDCNTITSDNTFYLNDFINFKISAHQSKEYNDEIAGGLKSDLKNKIITKTDYEYQLKNLKTAEGDTAILVGMHVGTKEIKRWVWQTFWWSPTPLTPSIPSSDDIASAKNGIGLQGAASHYAMDIAYSMIIPAQPYIGGKNEGELVVGFNPYLESGFGTDVFDSKTSYVMNSGTKIQTDLGTMSNCMSCHMSAAVKTSAKGPGYGSPDYVGDRYLSYKDSIFKNRLMLDFAWSIQSNIDSLK
ncbi:hypothetical protein [Tenacibaculum agarivorans]|uniref:hypothetical protein n=1 Tax=Tenacibaculum agarivorans TaxID=1908389 RepID=UPI00094BA7E1|nr:hypothetical protein [Tenacibaculum agarivorans]